MKNNRNRSNDPVGTPIGYWVRVEGNETLKDLFATSVGNEWVDWHLFRGNAERPDCSWEPPALYRGPSYDVKVELLGLPRDMSTSEVEVWLAKLGYRPASVTESRLLDLQNPDLQKVFFIFCVGGFWIKSGSWRRALVLRNKGRGIQRMARTHRSNPESRWCSGWRVAAVKLVAATN